VKILVKIYHLRDGIDYFNTLMNLKYDNNFNVKNICKYVDSNSDELNADITA
jgi:hypothetical protein